MVIREGRFNSRTVCNISREIRPKGIRLGYVLEDNQKIQGGKMKHIKAIKRKERERAVKAGIQSKNLREPLNKSGSKFRVVNPLRMVERKAVREYKKLNWKEKTKANS